METKANHRWSKVTKMNTIQERIKELREKHNLNQHGAANKFNMSTSTWSRIESGVREPSLQLIGKISQE